MKNYFLQLLLCLLSLSMCNWQTETLQAQTLMIDSFDKKSTSVSQKYPNYVSTQEGYDIYYESATVQLSRVPISSRNISDKALRLMFRLPPFNWLSVRREFQPPLNLEGYKGLELNLRIEAPSPNAFLRITILDLADEKRYGDEDEMWWFDCDKKLLKSKTIKWIQIRIPFDGFELSYGIGTRQNDHEKNLNKIIAYEVNLISESRTSVNGIVLLDSLRAYK